MSDESPPGLRLVFTIVGPIKRSTLETKHPRREWEAVSDVRNWAFCTRLQAERLRTSATAEMPWQSGHRVILTERRFATTSYDEHCLIVAAANLKRALQRAPRELMRTPFSQDTRRALELLRNVYEHWDELRQCYRDGGALRGAALKLAKDYPGVEPWSLTLQQDGDILVAGLVSLRSLNRDLRALEARALWRLRLLRRQGKHVAEEAPNPIGRTGG